MKKILLRAMSRVYYLLAFVAPQPGPIVARWLDRGMAALER